MNEYFDRLSKKPDIPTNRILKQDQNPYYTALNSDALEIITTALNTPWIEHKISHELAHELNKNLSEYDGVIDQHFRMTHIGGSGLHHNLDGSHTFHGALDVLRNHFPHDSDFTLKLHALNHLSRDFTTPSGINPFLDPDSFRNSKRFLLDFGFSASTANDLLNFNASELAGAVVGTGSILFRLQSSQAISVAEQAGRLLMTQFFSGNAMGMLAATAILIKLALQEHSDPLSLGGKTIIGAGQVLLAAALFPTHLSLAIILTSTLCVAGRSLITGYDMDSEMDNLLRHLFPLYRSYLAAL